MIANLKGWRTVIVNAVTGAPLVALAVLDQIKGVDISPLLPAGKAAMVGAGLAVANIVLRVLTTGPVGTKQ